jgi:hypothetical protein
MEVPGRSTAVIRRGTDGRSEIPSNYFELVISAEVRIEIRGRNRWLAYSGQFRKVIELMNMVAVSRLFQCS